MWLPPTETSERGETTVAAVGHSEYEDEVETHQTQWETIPEPGWEYYYGEILA